MGKVKCHICKKNNAGEICVCCGASLSPLMKEQLVFSSSGYTYLDRNGEEFSQTASCKTALTNQRLVIYKIKPEADNPAFAVFKAVVNAIRKQPFFSINLSEIVCVKRYSTRHLIYTGSATYCVWMNNFKKWEELFAPYKLDEEQ